MRHFKVRVPRGQGREVIDVAQEHDAMNVWLYPGRREDSEVDVIEVELTNRSVGSFLNEISSIDGMSATLYPNEIINFISPASKVPKQLRNLDARSPLEIFLLGIQSMGNWGGFLAYATAGALLVWIAFFTNSVYLLIAAMLISPFAGPAMNVAMATATSDKRLFAENLLRYIVAILVTATITGLLSLALQQSSVSSLMIGVGYVSPTAVLLPLVAGAAGALNLIQSERASLVSGTAVGLLVAASLAPSAGLLGTSLAMQQWKLVTSAIFLLLLQLVGINLSGTIVFRLRGLKSDLLRYDMGRTWLLPVSIVVSCLGLIALLVWQYFGPLQLHRSAQDIQAAQRIETIVNDSELAKFISVDADLLAPENREASQLLATVYVQSVNTTEYSPEVIEEQLRDQIQRGLMEETPDLQPFVDVIILSPPSNAQTAEPVKP